LSENIKIHNRYRSEVIRQVSTFIYLTFKDTDLERKVIKYERVSEAI
jgi:hypothetical protein